MLCFLCPVFLIARHFLKMLTSEKCNEGIIVVSEGRFQSVDQLYGLGTSRHQMFLKSPSIILKSPSIVPRGPLFPWEWEWKQLQNLQLPDILTSWLFVHHGVSFTLPNFSLANCLFFWHSRLKIMRYEGNVTEPSNSWGFVGAFWMLPEGPSKKTLLVVVSVQLGILTSQWCRF